MDTQKLLKKAIEAAELACTEILSVYQSNDFQAELKDDKSPLATME